MYPLRTQAGKFYVGNIEVEANPIYLGLESTVEYEGAVPQLETIIFDMLTNLKRQNNLDLFEANAYRCIIIGRKEMPEMNVPDGKVPSSGRRSILLDFYKIKPKE